MRGQCLPASPPSQFPASLRGSLRETEETQSQHVCSHLPEKPLVLLISILLHGASLGVSHHPTPGCHPSHVPTATSGGSMGALWETPLWKLSLFIRVMVAEAQGMYL